jgi:quercetin dioxygenase-like cupin family protein
MSVSGFWLAVTLTSISVFAQTHTDSVEISGVKPTLKFEETVKGFLQPINEKLKLRATEVEFAPGSRLGDHLHVGPGIRYVAAGELIVSDESDKVQVVKAGDYFYESGDKSLTVANRSSFPAKLIVFELVPSDWSGTAMAPVSRRSDLRQQGQKLQSSICGK